MLLLATTGRTFGAKRTAPLIYQRYGDAFLGRRATSSGPKPTARSRWSPSSRAKHRSHSRRPGPISSPTSSDGARSGNGAQGLGAVTHTWTIDS